MRSIETTTAPAAIGTYSQAIVSSNTVYLSGQIPLDPITMELCSSDIEQQIDQVFNNIAAVCKAAGGSLANIVKLNVYLLDLASFSLVNIAMEHYFTQPYPARAVIGVSNLPRNAKVEIDAIMNL
ncbi:MAG: reactive intermediate/imine deaminase [Legionellales bacterium RIFCSPHIGHO2_12_FULL_35_11]|nr:MAG: reactive intermediate/imine deaminase [Legionellales bacterium RIFCSPHIGHO2_12_FULL_35_11]